MNKQKFCYISKQTEVGIEFWTWKDPLHDKWSPCLFSCFELVIRLTLCIRVCLFFFLSFFPQEIKPYETKNVMRANFVGRVESNHTAFIRIKTDQDSSAQLLILPVEVEFSSGRPSSESLQGYLHTGQERRCGVEKDLGCYAAWPHSKPMEGYARDGKGGMGLKRPWSLASLNSFQTPGGLCVGWEGRYWIDESASVSSLHSFWITRGLRMGQERRYGVEAASFFFYPVWTHSKPLVGYAKDKKGCMGLMESVTVSSLHSFWITRGLPKGQERRSWIEGICTLIQSALILNH